MRTYNYMPNLTGLTVIKTFEEQEDKFWYKGHPEFVVPDFNPDPQGEDIWTSFLTYLEKNDCKDGEMYDQNGGECEKSELLDPVTGLTKCQYIADGCVMNEGDEPQDIRVYIEGYVIENAAGNAKFIATKVEVDMDGATPSSEGSAKPMSFCFTGVRLNELQAAFDAQGWVEKSGVAKGLDCLVAKDPASTSGKAKKARDLGIKVISLDEFKEMLGG